MSTDNTDAFAADVAEPRLSREELEAQLLEYKREDGQEAAGAVEPAEGALVSTGAVNDSEEDDGDYSRPVVQVRSEYLGREIGVIKPTDVAITMFQQDMSSGVLSDEDRLGIFGDFCREHVVSGDFREWRQKILRSAGRDPKNGQVIFYQETQALLELIVEQTEQTDKDAMDQAVNRAERRAAAKKKSQNASTGPRGGRR